MAKTKVYETTRYMILNDNHQIEATTTINKLNEATFGAFGKELPFKDPELSGKLKEVCLTISVQDVSEDLLATLQET